MAAIKHPTGTNSTITDETNDVCPLESVKPPTPFSSLGTNVAEKASEIPITMWKDAAVTAAKI